MIRWILGMLFVLVAAPAQAYCIYNQLADREVTVEQEPHPDKLRDDRRLRSVLKPGENRCCPFYRLDCNPGGRNNSVVNLAVTIPGKPGYECGFPEGAEPNVKVTGSGTIRILSNPRPKSAYPYIVRVRTHDRQDLTGPKGLVCPVSRSKGNR